MDLDDVAPLLPKIQRLSAYNRVAKMEETNDVDDMEAILGRRQFIDSLPETRGFAFGCTKDASGSPRLRDGSDERPVVIGFPSKTLIKNLAYATTNTIHMDATYKLSTNGYPIFVIGVSDVCRHFFPIALFILSDLKEPRIQTMLRELVHQYQKITNQLSQISYVMGDADNAQRNAVEAVAASVLPPNPGMQYLIC